jgi:DNA-directed RNA polymerase sigma subunit (sigma70/sigma32)
MKLAALASRFGVSRERTRQLEQRLERKSATISRKSWGTISR